jgi:hypothetical protein
MRLLVLAEIQGVGFGFERPALVDAARAVLCEEFNDVRLQWVEIREWAKPSTTQVPQWLWMLVAVGPGGDRDRCTWEQAGGRW